MKSKKILIAYLTGFISNPAPREYLFNKMINELIDEGREVQHTILKRDIKLCKFTDGSTIEMSPSLVSLKGKKVTHLYIEDSILNLDNGIQFAHDCLLPTVIEKGNYLNFDANTDKDDRIYTFNFNGSGVDIKQYKC